MKLYKNFLVGIAVFFCVVLGMYCISNSTYFSLENIQKKAAILQEYARTEYVWSVIIFLSVGIVLVALTLPVTGPLGVIAGFLFNIFLAVAYTMASVVTGAMISFLAIRYVMRHMISDRYKEQLCSFKNKFHTYGYTYLITLQLLTVVPYFIINTLAALADVSFFTFVWTTAVGTLPVVVIYAIAGRQLYMIKSWHDIMSVNMLLLLLMLALLALLPMIVKKLWGRTESFDQQ